MAYKQQYKQWIGITFWFFTLAGTCSSTAASSLPSSPTSSPSSGQRSSIRWCFPGSAARRARVLSPESPFPFSYDVLPNGVARWDEVAGAFSDKLLSLSLSSASKLPPSFADRMPPLRCSAAALSALGWGARRYRRVDAGNRIPSFSISVKKKVWDYLFWKCTSFFFQICMTCRVQIKHLIFFFI